MAKIGIFVGTVYGGAEDVALWAQEQLQQAGHQAECFIDESTLESFLSYQNDVVLVVTSTTGQGEIPKRYCHCLFICARHFLCFLI